MSSNIPFTRQSRRILPFLLNFSGMVGEEGGKGRKLEINIPPQQIYAKSKGGL